MSSHSASSNNLTTETQAASQAKRDNARAIKQGKDAVTNARKGKVEPPRGWKERSQYWTWNCYTANMGTGGVSILLYGISSPYTFPGQHALGTVFFLINLVLFLINTAGILSRLVYHPRSWRDSFYDHEDGIYIPCFGLACATLFVGIVDYGIPYTGFWLTRTMYVVYWVYIAVSSTIAMTLEITLRGRYRSLETITPADCLLFFPFMLSGTIGSALATQLPSTEAGYIVVLSFWLQGLGFMLSLLKLAVWQARAMLLPNPAPTSIPGLLIAVGPPGFTAFAFLNLGNRAVEVFPVSNILQAGGNGGQVFQYINVWFSFPLLGMGLYLFLSILTIWIRGMIHDRQFKWAISWWSFTFPLVGFFMAIGQLGSQLPSRTCTAIQVFGTCWVSLFWLINFPMTLYNVFISKTLGVPKEVSDASDYHIWDGLKAGQVKLTNGGGTGGR